MADVLSLRDVFIDLITQWLDLPNAIKFGGTCFSLYYHIHQLLSTCSRIDISATKYRVNGALGYIAERCKSLRCIRLNDCSTVRPAVINLAFSGLASRLSITAYAFSAV